MYKNTYSLSLTYYQSLCFIKWTLSVHVCVLRCCLYFVYEHAYVRLNQFWVLRHNGYLINSFWTIIKLFPEIIFRFLCVYYR